LPVDEFVVKIRNARNSGFGNARLPGGPLTTRIRGVLAPVVTPFGADLGPDEQRLLAHCRWLLANGVALAPFGTTSEANSLSVTERTDLLDHLVGNGIEPARLMPGTGCSSITDSVTLTAHAMKHGCSGVLMLPPFYYKGVSDDGLFRNFAEVIERVGDAGLRIYLYNIPPVSQVTITHTLIERLLEAYPSAIAGLKDSSGDWAVTKAYLDAFAAPEFDIFPGSEAFLLDGLRHGGAGCISATANVNPGPIARLASSWQDADAHSQQGRLSEIRGIFGRRPLIPALKAAIARYSGDPAWTRVRPPLVELSAGETDSLFGELNAAGFSMSGLR
jgi:4-hydroxy-tetrahydrodipicolinate synthase